jgi:hypothetical protein
MDDLFIKYKDQTMNALQRAEEDLYRRGYTEKELDITSASNFHMGLRQVDTSKFTPEVLEVFKTHCDALLIYIASSKALSALEGFY